MTTYRIAGFASIVCAITYLFGFAFLVRFLAPFGYGTDNIDNYAVVRFILATPNLMIMFNTIIYIVNAFALVLLVLALQSILHAKPRPSVAVQFTKALGLIWATLVLAAGMVANAATEHSLSLAEIDIGKAANQWSVLHAVELGLGGGNEIVGAAFILTVSVIAFTRKRLAQLSSGIGLLTGLAGIATLVPHAGDFAGAVFGLGAIAWFILIGAELLIKPQSRSA